ncbi:hypothetical protein NDU88_008657 [Pleurodeles waltl]|uniref:Uncharacterized protein n=1 Tax=Pleurodeles waltl TaxID=8319 RepID=A0AAV7PR10_PLEWA|nr:hypothetical protein NDU88_008657 [Pleurodeles waltl]
MAAPLGPPGKKPTSRPRSQLRPTGTGGGPAAVRSQTGLCVEGKPGGTCPARSLGRAEASRLPGAGPPGSGGRGCLASARGRGVRPFIIGPGQLEQAPSRGGGDPWSWGLPLDRGLGATWRSAAGSGECPAESDRLGEWAVAAPPIKESCQEARAKRSPSLWSVA